MPSAEPWAVALRDEYGSVDNLFKTFAPASTGGYACDTTAAALTPSVVRLCKSYGNRTIATLFSMHIAAALAAMVSETPSFTTDDINRAAAHVATDDRIRTTPIGVVLAFFHRAAAMRYRLYGQPTPYKLLQALQEHLPALQAAAQSAQREQEAAAAREADRRHAAAAMNWEQYAASRGITDPNPLTALQR